MQIRNKSLLCSIVQVTRKRIIGIYQSFWPTPPSTNVFTWFNVLTGVTKIVTVFCPLRYRMTLCLKSDDSAHLSYRFVYLIVLNETKKLNVDTNLSTTEHAFTESCEGYIYILLWKGHYKNMIIVKDKHIVRISTC